MTIRLRRLSVVVLVIALTGCSAISDGTEVAARSVEPSVGGHCSPTSADRDRPRCLPN